MLGADLLFRMPVLGSLARKSGQTLACIPDAERLLASGELVGVWPEGFKGLGKNYRDRYKLQRFGRGGFVAAALRSQAMIIPCAIVGAEEIYPMIGDVKPLARLLGTPYFPVGTTCYAWTHQPAPVEEQTLATLKAAPFNKLRMCVLPKWYAYNRTERTSFIASVPTSPRRRGRFTRRRPQQRFQRRRRSRSTERRKEKRRRLSTPPPNLSEERNVSSASSTRC